MNGKPLIRTKNTFETTSKIHDKALNNCIVSEQAKQEAEQALQASVEKNRLQESKYSDGLQQVQAQVLHQ